MVADLKRFLNDEPVSAAAPSLAYQFQKLARRHKTAFRAAAAIAAIFVIASVVSTGLLFRAIDSERDAVDAKQTATELLETERGLRQKMEIARNEAELLRIDADRKLYRSFMDQARLTSVIKEAGFRSKTESFLRKADALDTDIEDEVEMRNQAIVVMLEPHSADPNRMGVFTPHDGNPDVFCSNLVRDEFAALDTDGSIEIYDISRLPSPVAVFDPGSGPVQDLAFGRDGNTLVSAHQGGASVSGEGTFLIHGRWNGNYLSPQEAIRPISS